MRLPNHIREDILTLTNAVKAGQITRGAASDYIIRYYYRWRWQALKRMSRLMREGSRVCHIRVESSVGFDMLFHNDK